MKQDGFTLVEILLASLFVVLIVVTASRFIYYFFESYNFSFEENQAIIEAQRGIKTFTEEVREMRDGEDGSYPLTTVIDQEIVFYSDVDDDGETERVRYYLVDEQLVKQVFNYANLWSSYRCLDECTICHQPGQSDQTITIPETAWPGHRAHGDYVGTCGEGEAGGGGGGGGEDDYEIVVADYVRNDGQPLFYYYNKDWPADTDNNPLELADRQLDTRMVKVDLFININPNNKINDFNVSTFTNLRNLKDNL